MPRLLRVQVESVIQADHCGGEELWAATRMAFQTGALTEEVICAFALWLFDVSERLDSSWEVDVGGAKTSAFSHIRVRLMH